ncbi:MAG: hypothetical protein K2N31_05725 [Treponemataceae bacterium]|nr:hypothetical protein [Treponemataceae bacterium]
MTATVGDTVATADVTVTVAAEGSTPPSQTENYTLNIENLTALGNVKESSKDFDTTVTKIWAVATNKSIQGFANGTPPFIKMTGGGANVSANAEYGLQVKISAAATITITALSKQGKSTNQWILKGMDGASDVDSTGTPAVAAAELKSDNLSQNTKPATLTFADVPAGTYMLGPKADGGYLFSLKIAYK